MDVEMAEILWLGITKIEAQNTLVDLAVSVYPKMKQDKAREYHREIFKKAYPELITKTTMTKELVERMNNGK